MVSNTGILAGRCHEGIVIAADGRGTRPSHPPFLHGTILVEDDAEKIFNIDGAGLFICGSGRAKTILAVRDRLRDVMPQTPSWNREGDALRLIPRFVRDAILDRARILQLKYPRRNWEEIRIMSQDAQASIILVGYVKRRGIWQSVLHLFEPEGIISDQNCLITGSANFCLRQYYDMWDYEIGIETSKLYVYWAMLDAVVTDWEYCGGLVQLYVLTPDGRVQDLRYKPREGFRINGIIRERESILYEAIKEFDLDYGFLEDFVLAFTYYENLVTVKGMEKVKEQDEDKS